jgi:hypothetical protein
MDEQTRSNIKGFMILAGIVAFLFVIVWNSVG